MSKRSAFTLVELCVVIAIIGILVGLLLRLFKRLGSGAAHAMFQTNLKQLTLALHNYESAFKTFPPSGINSNQMSWIVLALPYIEQDNLYRNFNLNQGAWNANNRIAVVQGVVPTVDPMS